MAKVYLQAALPNFTILMSSELIGQTHLRLAEISYYNG